MSSPILITGVGKRLGFSLAQRLLNEGYSVIGTYRTERQELEELRASGADLYQVDFYQAGALEHFLDNVITDYTSIRAIVHNASDWLPDSNLPDKKLPDSKVTEELSSAEIMNRMMTIHAAVPYQINLALKELLGCHEPSSDIIHISDYVAEKGSKKHIAYAASKAALNNLTLSFSALLAPKVKVNTISPALIKFNEQDTDQYKEKAVQKALIQSEAGFDEIIDGVLFILSSHYMTGRNLNLDGGRHLK
ncbi:dihydromonapterin reductase [uncultured Vibrio sp.]|uniref:dihydromonapterin reductase n=1 Tax=uncultured Vibrio sp. TaxID=114054 RepID=UPI000916D78C|nr:dihydromonapterin reductase [uncultured Vibrio sp.]OIQ26089.1 MAG: dihydromonapterin reductase [Vibrio sp. MedPE-SWchi]